MNSLLGVVLLAGGGLAYATVNADATPSGRSGQTRTATVAKGTVLATVSGSGTLASPTDAGVDFVTGGTLTSVKVEVGDTVKKGQVLAKVSTTDAQAKVDAAEAALNTAEAALTKAQAGEEVTTTIPGSSTGSGSASGSAGGRVGAGQSGGQNAGQTTPQPTTTTTVKVDASQVAQAEQQVTDAQNSLSDAQDALAGTVLKAPVGGTVASVGGKVGDTVSGTGSSSSGSGQGGSGGSGSSSSSSSSSSTPSGFVVITNPSGMQVDASFSESDALKIKKGQAASVTLNAQSDTQLNAKVLSISSLPTSSGSGSGSGSNAGSAVQYAAKLQITSDTSALRTGMSATVSVVTGEADNALYVPTNAVSGTGASRTATVVKDDGSTERRTVQVGIEGDSSVQVTSGLSAGEKVELTSTTTSGSNGFPSGAFPGAGGFGGGAGFGGAGFGGGGRNFGGGARR